MDQNTYMQSSSSPQSSEHVTNDSSTFKNSIPTSLDPGVCELALRTAEKMVTSWKNLQDGDWSLIPSQVSLRTLKATTNFLTELCIIQSYLTGLSSPKQWQNTNSRTGYSNIHQSFPEPASTSNKGRKWPTGAETIWTAK